jgi:hypothetical protein
MDFPPEAIIGPGTIHVVAFKAPNPQQSRSKANRDGNEYTAGGE